MKLAFCLIRREGLLSFATVPTDFGWFIEFCWKWICLSMDSVANLPEALKICTSKVLVWNKERVGQQKHGLSMNREQQRYNGPSYSTVKLN